MRNRETVLDACRQSPYVDVLIVGGGINGIGIYRDLAAQGVAALLVEQGDFCSGTSAAPSRLIHGGLRYLETGEFRLVRESVRERNRLLANAPHLVRPIPVWMPLETWFAGLARAPARLLHRTAEPGPKGAVLAKLGLLMYDRFSGKAPGMPNHRLIGRQALRVALPSIAPQVRLAAEFYDARIVHPERLALELVADAERDQPASAALPYVELDGLESTAVRLRDALSGTPWTVRPRLVVNAAGAWVDRVNQRLGLKSSLVGGTRGSHLVLRHPALARELGGRMIYFETADHRVCLAYPLGGALVLLGTTDIRSDDPDDRACTETEVDYLFDVLARVLPGQRAGREHIVFRYAGVRPLPRMAAASTGAISRDHHLHSAAAVDARPFDVLSLVGGKWTTYRACAAQVTDAVLARLDRERRVDTATLAIGGGRDWPVDDADRRRRLRAIARGAGLREESAARLWQRYGSTAHEVAATIATTSAATMADLPGHLLGEIVHIVRHERVTRLADLLLRRSLVAFEGRCDGAGLRALAAVAGAELGWDTARRMQEETAAANLLTHRHGARIGTETLHLATS